MKDKKENSMNDLCNGCKDNTRFCIIKENGIDPKDCPCSICSIKSICDETCDAHYALRYKERM